MPARLHNARTVLKVVMLAVSLFCVAAQDDVAAWPADEASFVRYATDADAIAREIDEIRRVPARQRRCYIPVALEASTPSEEEPRGFREVESHRTLYVSSLIK